MLELRPNCEYCNIDLPAESREACICSYECTFCTACVQTILQNVCPNCGGGFVQRPIRPSTAHRAGVSIKDQPASTTRVNTPYSLDEIQTFTMKISSVSPAER